MTYDELVALARSVGVPSGQLDTAAALGLAESAGKPDATGDETIQTEKWGPSVGLWQIRSLKTQTGTGQQRDRNALLDPLFNAKAMCAISSGGTDWRPWGAYTNGSYRKFLRGGTMGCVAAPACKAALAEATRLWPSRRKTSDGICGDPRHQARESDHNAGNAWDLSHDPAHGCDAHALVEGIRRRQDKRVKYIISNRRICGPGSSGGGWNWKPYSGGNPHSIHAHVSIWPSARNSTAPWFGGTVQITPAPTPGTTTTFTAGRPFPSGAERLPGGGYSILQGGSVDENVRYAQKRAIANGHDLQQEGGADGRFGPGFEREIKAFQAARGLKPDGVIGPMTWARLG